MQGETPASKPFYYAGLYEHALFLGNPIYRWNCYGNCFSSQEKKIVCRRNVKQRRATETQVERRKQLRKAKLPEREQR